MRREADVIGKGTRCHGSLIPNRAAELGRAGRVAEEGVPETTRRTR